MAVDDHRAFRTALRDLVAATPGFVLVGAAGTGEEALDVLDCLAPEMVLMDVVMPGIGGIAAAKAILERRPQVLMVLVSVDDPRLDPGAASLGNEVICARKQDLRPGQLRRFWNARRSRMTQAPK